MGLFCPSLHIGYCSPIPDAAQISTIFYYGALCVISALLWVSQLPTPPHRLLIYTDSMNSVEMFHSLKALEGYNDLLLFAVGILIWSHMSLCVFHVPSMENGIDNALSHQLFHIVDALHPGLTMCLF
jgi:hypothetical protein